MNIAINTIDSKEDVAETNYEFESNRKYTASY